MSAGFDLQLVLALAIVAVALVLFGMHLLTSARDAGHLISECKVPRRYLLLGLAAGVGILYAVRR